MVHGLLGARDRTHFFEDLAAVANAGRGLDGGGGGRVALDLLVVAGRATQREGLPLVIGRGRLLFADVRRERGLVGGDLVDFVFEVFAIANGRVGLLGIRGNGHLFSAFHSLFSEHERDRVLPTACLGKPVLEGLDFALRGGNCRGSRCGSQGCFRL